jgi:hypothetical protein
MGGGLLLWKQCLGCFRYRLNIGHPLESYLWCMLWTMQRWVGGGYVQYMIRSHLRLKCNEKVII